MNERENTKGFTPTPMRAQSSGAEIKEIADVAPTFQNTGLLRDVDCKSTGHALVWGFTLIEALLVIAILSILASIVIVAINPARQLSNTRDAERLSDVYTIMNALHQYAADNDGAYPSTVTTTELEVCATDAPSCTELSDLSILTDDETYLVDMPSDPLCGIQSGYCSTNGVGYHVQKTTNGRMTVSAHGAENASTTVTR